MVELASGKLLRGHPLPEDVEKVLHTLREADDRTMVISGGALLQYCTNNLLKSHMTMLDKEKENRIFNNSKNGFLSNFSSQILTLLAFDFITEEVYDNLNTIGTIRNVFAHSLHNISFMHPDVKADCFSLTLHGGKEAADKQPEDARAKIYFHNSVFTLTVLLNLFDVTAKKGRATTKPPPPVKQEVIDMMIKNIQVVFQIALNNLKGEPAP